VVNPNQEDRWPLSRREERKEGDTSGGLICLLPRSGFVQQGLGIRKETAKAAESDTYSLSKDPIITSVIPVKFNVYIVLAPNLLSPNVSNHDT
jgi:hypothetical protein